MSIEEAIREYGTDVLRICLMYLRDRTRAEDAFQETFIRVHRHMETLMAADSPKAWILRVAVNVCKDMLKGFWWRKVMTSGALESSQRTAAGSNPEDTVIARLEGQTRKQAVTEAVSKLPGRFRDVVILYYFQDQDTARIAETLRLPEGTVRSRLHRARKLLQDHLKGWKDRNEPGN